MKELVKPNSLEEMYENVDAFQETCDLYCSCSGFTGCNRYCSGDGSSNQSPIQDEDIIF